MDERKVFDMNEATVMHDSMPKNRTAKIITITEREKSSKKYNAYRCLTKVLKEKSMQNLEAYINAESKVGLTRLPESKAALFDGYDPNLALKMRVLIVLGMSAVALFSGTRRFGCSSPKTVLEVLSFANKFCRDETKSGCDVYLASCVCSLKRCIEKGANPILAYCLQVLLRELPSALNNPKLWEYFVVQRLVRAKLAGMIIFVILFSQLGGYRGEEDIKYEIKLLGNIRECAVGRWQKALALHQLGCILPERNDDKDAKWYFDAAIENGQVYSLVTVARIKYKQEQRFLTEALCKWYTYKRTSIHVIAPTSYKY